MSKVVKNEIGMNELSWLVLGLTMAAIPHYAHMPFWIMILFIILVVKRLWEVKQNASLLEKKELLFIRISQTLLMIGGFIGVYIHFGTLSGRDAGVALLILLTGFKILETKTARDFYIANFLGYFLIITNFFFTQSLDTATFMAITLLVLVCSLISFNDDRKNMTDIDRIRYAGLLLIQAFPIMLVLFLLFPRIDGPLWGLPKDAHTGQIGISGTMEPGMISRLVQSGAVAFRVKWENKIPEQASLYWRGPVLWHNDGSKWTPGEGIGINPVAIRTTGDPINYTITIEPNNKRWLFALEMAGKIPAQGYLTDDFKILTKNPIHKPTRYTLSSYINYTIPAKDRNELYRALQFPSGYHQKTIAYVKAWREENLTPLQIVERALHWFNEDEFYYTLTPPLLAQDNIDEFLFGTKQGFCEHYASAFVMLMRAAGIPARVVTGYQGGTFNPIGDYMIVYQRNAHAWAEVWLGEQGWVRIDPTAAVSPARINQGIETALPEALLDVPLFIGQNIFARYIWQRFRNSWDAINNQWNQWVISYGPQRQTQFLQQFGMRNVSWQNLSIALLITVGVVITILSILIFTQITKSHDPAKVLYEKFCRKLARRGVQRRPSEGPLAFAARASRKCNEKASAINNITRHYIEARYHSRNDHIALLKEHVRSFSP